jgi:hypothetical protein
MNLADMARLAIGAAWSGAAITALAAPPQTVYRCGPEGRVYSQAPCADGKPVTIDDPRSASQQSAAREVAARDAQQARQLAEERRQREAAAAGQGMVGIKAAQPAEGKASAPARKVKKGKPTVTDSAPSPPLRATAPTPASK